MFVEIDYTQIKDITYLEPVLIPRNLKQWATYSLPQVENPFFDSVKHCFPPIENVALYNGILRKFASIQVLEVGDTVYFDLSRLVEHGESEETFEIMEKTALRFVPTYPSGTCFGLTLAQWEETPVYLYQVSE